MHKAKQLAFSDGQEGDYVIVAMGPNLWKISPTNYGDSIGIELITESQMHHMLGNVVGDVTELAPAHAGIFLCEF